MRDSGYDTVVCSLGGDAQLRRVVEVREWRVEQGLGSDRLVFSITTGSGSECCFLVANVDALDIAQVLSRRTQPSPVPDPVLSLMES